MIIMLSHKILSRGDVGRAANYYADAADDYYSKEVESTEWQGNGAKELNLKGDVDRTRFQELLTGKISQEIKISRNSTRKDSKQRIGIDLTFSAPKSVSLQSLIHGDPNIIKAHDTAVAKTLLIAEERAQARQKINGKSRVENTKNLVIAKFRHETSRELDPQLHTHAVILNLTKRSDGKWRALKNDEIIKSTRYLGSVYNTELAAELQKLGFQLRYGNDGNFELAHISRTQIEGFSQRSGQIEQKLAEKGLTRNTATVNEKQLATLQSRERKISVDRKELHKEWLNRSKELGIDFDQRSWSTSLDFHNENLQSTKLLPSDEAAKRAVRYSINHLTERQSIISERILIDTALKHGVGNVTLDDIHKEIVNQINKGALIIEKTLYKPATESFDDEKILTRIGWINELSEKGISRQTAKQRVNNAIDNGGLIPIENRYTTQKALKCEQHILKLEKSGRDQFQPIISKDILHERLSQYSLSEGQRDAVKLILSTTNKIVGIQGYAGTGKSYLLSTVSKMLEEQGYRIRGLASYALQVKNLQNENIPSNTLASFLKAKDKGIDDRTVLVIDESGIVPARMMEQTLILAERANARVILIGDIAQTKAIEAGKPFEQLQLNGMETAYMKNIQRQKNSELKKAVEYAAQGNTSKSLKLIDDIIEIKDDHERRKIIAEEYVSLSPEDKERTIIVSGTNEARREINDIIRQGLGTSGKGLEINILIRRDSTQAERRYSKNFRVGDIIQPEKNYQNGLERGMLYSVVDTGPGNRLTVKAQNDQNFIIQFNPSAYRKLSIYKTNKAELSPDDIVRITRNDKELDVANGDRFKIKAIDKDIITLFDGKRQIELSTKNPVHLDYAYATTIHSSQGTTSDRVLIDTETESRTTAQDVYYVAISRARKEARIFTNDLSKLPSSIAKKNIKHAALDLTRKDIQTNLQSKCQLEQQQILEKNLEYGKEMK